MILSRLPAAALGASLLLLGGCGGLLGGGGRADLYRFGTASPPPAAEPQAAALQPGMDRPLLVLFAGTTFDRAIESDRILTVTGPQAAYVAAARWVAPADDLFDAAALRAFEARAPAARLVRLRGSPMPDYAIGIDIRRFEADYVAGPEAAPEVVVEGRLRLMRWGDRTLIGEWPVLVREPAAENRLPSIVDAFDRATTEAVTRMADTTQQALASQPRIAQRSQ